MNVETIQKQYFQCITFGNNSSDNDNDNDN